MKILYFDCFSGISGDMTVGALIDLGVDEGRFLAELDKLNLEGYSVIIGKKTVNGICGTDVQVVLDHDHDHDHDHEHDHNHDHEHDHNHDHEHDHNHDHDHEHDHNHGHNHDHDLDHNHEHIHISGQTERNLRDIVEIIEKSNLSSCVKDFSKAVFVEIAHAEAKVHGKSVDEVHFHEVGALDSIVDIVGTAICIEILGIDRVYSSPLHDGNGFIECRHGTIPVPVPAVMEMLSGSGIPLISEDVGTELVTPTGMGIIKHIAQGFGTLPAMKPLKTGYGMGKRNTGRLNALRVILGEAYEPDVREKPAGCFSCTDGDEIIVLETNIDDMSPEILGYTANKLFEHGALDVFYTPIYMKKGRPAFMLTVLSNPAKENELTGILLTETSTLGIRKSAAQRSCMARETANVKTEYGNVRVKVASNGAFRKASPEYEDCRVIAERTGIPLIKIYETVMENARKELGI